MKLNRKILTLLASSTVVWSAATACGGKDTNRDPLGEGGEGGGGSIDDETPYPGPMCDVPGGSQCTGTASGLTCPEGSTNAVEFTCAQGDVCVEGECRGQCEAGATECVGDSVERICAADGRSWVNVQCQAGLVCEDGRCGLEGGAVCVPGAKECGDDGTQSVCREDGSGWDEVVCPGESVCSEGECRGSVCTVGETRCDDSTDDIPGQFHEYSGTDEPNFAVVFRCVDGDSWVAEPCGYDEENDRARGCSYEGLDGRAVARYRAEVNDWYRDVQDYYYYGEGSMPESPTPPAVPASAKAVCAPQDCDWEQGYFESPNETRDCGTLEDDGDSRRSFVQCDGIAPFAPMQANQYDCEGLSACFRHSGMSGQPVGCYPVDCLPEERQCSGETSYQECYFDGEGEYYGYGWYWGEGLSCPDSDPGGPGGAPPAPGACADVGEEPERNVTCAGEEIDDEIVVEPPSISD